MRVAAGRRDASDVRRGNLWGLVARYALLTFGGSWACWFAATALLAADAAGALHALAGALQVMGTLMPPLAAYALFGRVKACGLAGTAVMWDGGAADPGGDGRPDPRAGFWRFAFGGVPPLSGWAAFALLAVWRWAMFRAAFGFPETPGAAAANFFATLPALLLGGGFEEIGWRGVLQPALAAIFADLSDGRRARGSGGDAGAVRGQAAGALLAPLATGAVWAVWHLPLFAMPGAFQNGMAFLPFLGVAVALSYSFGAIRALGGTLVLPILCHAWYNAMLVAVPQPCALGFALFAAEAAAGAAALAWSARRRRSGGTG